MATARRNQKTRDEAKERSDTPDRPDRIAPMDGDPGELIETIDVPGRKGAASEVDINQPARTDDARTDKEKDDERQRQVDQDRLGGGNDDDDSASGRRIRRRGRGDNEESQKVQRRVEREKALRRKSDEKVTNLTRENQQIKDRLARIERAGNTDDSAKTLKGFKDQLAALQIQLTAAIEAGESAKQAEIQMKIGDVQTEQKLLERDIEAAKQRKDGGEEEETRGRDRPAGDTRPPIVDDFMRANRRWWNLPSAAKLKLAAVEIDKQIKAEIEDGDLEFDEYSEDHMDELTVRLAEEAERLELDVEIRDFNGDVFELEEDEQQEEQQDTRRDAANGRDKGKDVRSRNGGKGGPQGGMGGREGRRGAQSDLELAKQGRARLTEDDYQTMRVYGLNPNDDDHRKRFAKERVRTILTEAQRSGGGRGGSR